MSYELDEYKKKVREKALEVAAEQGWCIEGVNAALADLGIDGVTNRFRVTAQVTLEFEVTVGDEFDHNMTERGVRDHFQTMLNGAVSDARVEVYDGEWSFETDCSNTRVETVEALPTHG